MKLAKVIAKVSAALTRALTIPVPSVGAAVVNCSGAVTAYDTVALSTATAGDVEAVSAATQQAIGVAVATLSAAGILSVNLNML